MLLERDFCDDYKTCWRRPSPNQTQEYTDHSTSCSSSLVPNNCWILLLLYNTIKLPSIKKVYFWIQITCVYSEGEREGHVVMVVVHLVAGSAVQWFLPYSVLHFLVRHDDDCCNIFQKLESVCSSPKAWFNESSATAMYEAFRVGSNSFVVCSNTISSIVYATCSLYLYKGNIITMMMMMPHSWV